MTGLPPDIALARVVDGAGVSRDTVVLALSAPNGVMQRPLHLWEARSLLKSLALHTLDPLTARAVNGLIGGEQPLASEYIEAAGVPA